MKRFDVFAIAFSPSPSFLPPCASVCVLHIRVVCQCIRLVLCLQSYLHQFQSLTHLSTCSTCTHGFQRHLSQLHCISHLQNPGTCACHRHGSPRPFQRCLTYSIHAVSKVVYFTKRQCVPPRHTHALVSPSSMYSSVGPFRVSMDSTSQPASLSALSSFNAYAFTCAPIAAL